MDVEPDLCPRVPRVGDVWLSPDLRYFVRVLRPITLMDGTYVIRTLEPRLQGIGVDTMPRLATLVKERYTWISAIGDDPALLDHAASCFKTGSRLAPGDVVVDMEGMHGMVAKSARDVHWFVPSSTKDVYDLSEPMTPQWPITFVCPAKDVANGLHQIGYMAHRGQMWRF